MRTEVGLSPALSTDFPGQIDVTGHSPSCMSHPVQRSLLAATPSSCSHRLHGFPYLFVRNLLFILPGKTQQCTVSAW